VKHEVGSLRATLSQRLEELGVEERAWPGRDDGFASLLFGGEDFAHFHNDNELDIRLGKQVIAKERLFRLPDSTVHPDRSKGSHWHEIRFNNKSEVDEVVRLVKIAIAGLGRRK
jgi:hypothetical protein